MKSKQRLTDRLVRELPAPASGAQIFYDADLPGFGARVTAASARAYILNYRVGGRERRYTIGSAAEWKTAAARTFAASLKARIRLGHDPLGELEQKRAEPTMAALVDLYVEESFGRLRPASVKMYRAVIEGTAKNRGIREHFRHARVANVRQVDVEAFHREMSRGAPTLANRALAVLSRMFTLAVRRGWRTDNPVKGTERNRETKRTRYLSPAEIARLTTALAGLADQQAADVFRLLLLTGARKSEVLGMRWTELDLSRGLWVKPGAATKQKTEHRTPLSAPALQLLARLPRVGEWVFPGKVEGAHRTEVKAQWASVCKAAGIEGVRMHDVRHTYASVLASAGLSLPIIGALLGHSQPATTARYAHLMDDPLRAATERVGAIVTGLSSADVMPMERIDGRA